MAARTHSRIGKVAADPGKPKAPSPKAVAAARDGALPPAGKPEVRIFVSYSHVDAAARAKLETHLAPLLRDGVKTWFDGRMDPGDALDVGISRALRQAHLLIALLSPEYISSRYCQLEYDRAMARRARGTMRVVGVVVRPCGWKETSAAGFKLLPEDGRNVLEWRSADAAFLDVARGIGKLVRTIRAEMAAAVKPSPPIPKAKPAVKVKALPAVPKAKPATKAPASAKPRVARSKPRPTSPAPKAKSPRAASVRRRSSPKPR
jgi:hypothetical protein